MTWAFRRYSEGDLSLSMLLDAVTDRGLTSRPTPKRPAKPISLTGLHKVLSNPYYVGEITYRGVRYGGKHEPIVDLVTWQRVQNVLEAHNSAGDRFQTHDHYLKGSPMPAWMKDGLPQVRKGEAIK